jgi:3-deoxy-manno-octulosonate cytidylyltransferase (CMP-KDO synthetase)
MTYSFWAKKTCIIIPARLNSTRLPNKPLLKIGNRTMLEIVYQKAKKLNCNKLIVATDSKLILNFCKKKNIKCLMTSKKCKSGTDRLSELSHKIKSPWLLSIQCDEPMFNIMDIRNLLINTFKYKKKNFSASTLYVKKNISKNNINEAKIVLNKDNQVIYFSRNIIPYKRENNNKFQIYKHIGIYLYKRNFLKKFSKLKNNYLENTEKLEQLRLIENNFKIIAFKAKKETIGVDTLNDLHKVRKIFKRGYEKI